MAETKKEDGLLPAGIRFFNPNDAAPDFVVGEMVVTMVDFLAYWKAHPEFQTEYEGKKQMKIQLLISKNDRLYGRVNDYKPEKVEGKRPPRPGASKEEDSVDSTMTPATEVEDDLPF